MSRNEEKRSNPAVRTLAMPGDTNPSGDVFGGWLLANMDIAAGIVGYEHAGGRVATVAVDGMSFLKPVYVGDVVSFYAVVVRTGRTSLTIQVECMARRSRTGDETLVTQGKFTMVALTDDGKPRPIKQRI